MKHLFVRAALAAAVISVAVACAGTTPAPTATRAPSATAPGASAPAVASPSPAAVPTPTGIAPASLLPGGPSLDPIFSSHADPALEALLPATVSGTALTRYSLTLTQVLDAGADRVGITAFLQGISKTEADGSYASAFDPTNSLAGGISAFKVAGADAAALLAGITTLELSDFGTGATTEQQTVGNKNVTVVSVGTGVNDTEWIYGYGDVVFVVHAPDEAHAAAFLAALP